eukprot:3170459-Rhodomonas_salina.1
MGQWKRKRVRHQRLLAEERVACASVAAHEACRLHHCHHPVRHHEYEPECRLRAVTQRQRIGFVQD